MMERIAEAWLLLRARTTGVVYLLYFMTAILGAFLTPTTANNILAHERSFRLGFAVSLIAIALYIAVTALFYNRILRPTPLRSYSSDCSMS